ncbi:hypothetical protein HQ394_05525 [Defluviicoccus vanus]|uniref:Uncharacterized protein n=1 Tax=Defluviicoccus vanus TaxID=111831 RepID=A0A7H1MZM7_9PROT|nr:hypothetical protein HQ394_05525 [Defluviicoccus vanus]
MAATTGADKKEKASVKMAGDNRDLIQGPIRTAPGRAIAASPHLTLRI